MKELTTLNLAEIKDNSSRPRITIYLSKDDTILEQKNIEVRIKHLLQKIEFLLLKRCSRKEVDFFMNKLNVEVILETYKKEQSSLVLFYSPDVFENKIAFLKVSHIITESVFVSDRFCVEQLDQEQSREKGYLVVTMSSRAINVLIEIKGHFVRLDSFRNDSGVQRKAKRDTKVFFTQTSEELNKLFTSYRIPVVLAGVKDHVGQMKKMLNHSFVLSDSIIGNVEKMKSIELKNKILELVKTNQLSVV
jgi:hypothetical protein